MNPLQTAEFSALRATIGSRGGLRLTLSLAGLAVWAVTMVAMLAWLPNPIAGTIPLLLLVATFEVNRMLHLGVERIGRYLQVFYEESQAPGTDAPAWEQSAMRFGPTAPGAGGHPLLVPLFFFATLINFLSVVLPGPIESELGVMAVPHVSFVIWMLYADRAMRQQRTRDLERFRALFQDAARRRVP